MSRRSLSRFSVVVAALALLASPLCASARQREHYRGRKYKPPPPVCRIHVTVVRQDAGTPIRNAAVVFQDLVHGKNKGSMELKTNMDGIAELSVIPIGDDVLLQVLAKGYQTFGRVYEVRKPDMTLEIKMKLPGQQYSVYDNRDTADEGAGNSSGGSKSSQPENGSKNNSSNGSGSSSKSSSSDSQKQ